MANIVLCTFQLTRDISLMHDDVFKFENEKNK